MLHPVTQWMTFGAHTLQGLQLPAVQSYFGSGYMCTPGQSEFCAAYAWVAQRIHNYCNKIYLRMQLRV